MRICFTTFIGTVTYFSQYFAIVLLRWPLSLHYTTEVIWYPGFHLVIQKSVSAIRWSLECGNALAKEIQRVKRVRSVFHISGNILKTITTNGNHVSVTLNAKGKALAGKFFRVSQSGFGRKLLLAAGWMS